MRNGKRFLLAKNGQSKLQAAWRIDIIHEQPKETLPSSLMAVVDMLVDKMSESD